MLNFANTRIARSVSRPVAPNTMILQEGLALVANGVGCSASAGSAGEKFIGFSYSQQNNPAEAPFIQELSLDSAASGLLSRAPVAGSLLVQYLNADGTVGATVTRDGDDSAPAAGAFMLTNGNRITGNVADASKKYLVSYRFVPSAVEAAFFQGHVLPGGDSGHILNAVGVIIAGDVFTSEYDNAIDWAAVATTEADIKLGANGRVTTAGSGVVIPKLRVIAVPSAGQPYLGLSLDNG